MPLEFSKNTSKVQQLYDYIFDQIASGSLIEGDSLPSINTLSKTLNISRDTVYKALSQLKENKFINSSHGRGFFVSTKISKVLLILDEYSQFKEDFYLSLLNNLPSENYIVDLFFHQYNKKLFNSLITDAVGRYNNYVIMNLSNDYLTETIELIDKDKLILIDYGGFEKEDFSFVTQNFDINFYNALNSIKEKLQKYQKLVFQLNKKHKHPRISLEWFIKFCHDNHFEYEIIEHDIELEDLQRGCFYIVIRQKDIVDLVKYARKKELQFAKDIGLIAYNDISFYEIIENGISSMTIDWAEMGQHTAQFIKSNVNIQTVMPTKVILRNSF